MARRTKAICMKLEFGSIRQKIPGGPFYFRYQINGRRKEVPLRTANRKVAEAAMKIWQRNSSSSVSFEFSLEAK